MKKTITFICFTTIMLNSVPVRCEDIVKRVKRQLLFPPTSSMGIFLAIATPIDLPDYELAFSYNFEANYFLPDNITELALGPQLGVRKFKEFTRKFVYGMLENKFSSEGLVGRPCLLRTICETSAAGIEGHNGLVGDLLHIIFTPSTSATEDIPSEFEEAEKYGHCGREACKRKYFDCPFDVYDFFSLWN